MVKISAAVSAFKEAGLPYVVYLRHPTTGGVFASWGRSATSRSPSRGARRLPRASGLRGAVRPSLPRGRPDLRNLHEHGLIDAVLPVEGLRDIAHTTLNLLVAPREEHPRSSSCLESRCPTSPRGVDHLVAPGRAPQRPALLKLGATDVIPLHGTNQGEYDPALMLALARFGGAACVVLGQNRRGQSIERPLTPSGLRAARRGIRLAHELKLPLVSVIDTAGAAPSKEAEEGGLAGEIARCLRAGHARRADDLRPPVKGPAAGPWRCSQRTR